ncbi:MAG: MATE family efflux transporter [Phycisphaerales bacterium]
MSRDEESLNTAAEGDARASALTGSAATAERDVPPTEPGGIRGMPGHPNLSEKPPVVELLSIAGPAVVTMVSYTIMQFVDMLIAAQLGPGAVAAVGNGGITAFVLSSALFGVLGLVNTYASQNLGAGRVREGAAYAWNGLWMVLIYWAAVIVPCAVMLPSIFAGARGLLGVEVDPDVNAMAVEYGRIAMYGMGLTLGARGLSHYFYGVHRAKWVMISALVANAVNVPVSFALVLGLWGFPAMGVAGAALGTVVGSAIELGILMWVFVGRRFAEELGTRERWRFSWAHCRDILRLGWPAGLMFGNELFCWWVFMTILVAKFGVAHNDAGWITLRYMHIAFMPAVGLSMAVTAVVGRVVGAGRADLATDRMKLGLKMAMAYMGVCALAMVLFRHELVGVFAHLMNKEQTPELDAHVREVIRIGGGVLIVAAAFQLFDALAITLVGALRGAGDTVWPGIVTAVLSWVWIIGGGLAVTLLFPEWGSLGPWSGAAMFIITLSLALAWRWRSGAWKRIEVVHEEAAGAPVAVHGAGGDRAEPDAPMEECGQTPDGLAGMLASPERGDRS